MSSDESPYSYNPTESRQRPAPVQELKHSGFGVASFIISMGAGLLCLAMFIVAGVMEASTPGGMSEEDPMVMLVGFGILAGGFAMLLGLVFGIAGLFQENRKKIFAILGLLLSLGGILSFGGLIVLGLAVGG